MRIATIFTSPYRCTSPIWWKIPRTLAPQSLTGHEPVRVHSLFTKLLQQRSDYPACDGGFRFQYSDSEMPRFVLQVRRTGALSECLSGFAICVTNLRIPNRVIQQILKETYNRLTRTHASFHYKHFFSVSDFPLSHRNTSV